MIHGLILLAGMLVGLLAVSLALLIRYTMRPGKMNIFEKAVAWVLILLGITMIVTVIAEILSSQ